YRLVSLLGCGGFAKVYLGQHVRLSMQAAIKVLHAHLSDEQINGFQQEAETIAKLVHPHIVRILDFDVSNGIPFLLMDYCPHGTLRKCHPKGEHVPLLTVVSYVQQVADALRYAHDQKLIHRDVKPENMLIGQRNDILLSDFGIASIAHSTSSMSVQVPVGTIPYMAPEQIQAHARPASDQYALGIVVYEWLCGERPFEGSYTEIFAKHLMTPPLPLRQKLPTLSPDVERVVLTALTKDPHQRFATVQAFATALEQASQAIVPPQWNTAPFQPTPPPPALTALTPSVMPVQTPIEMNTSSARPFPPTVPALATRFYTQTEPHPSTARPPMPKQSSSSSSFPLHKVHITAKKPKMALYIIGAIPMAAMGAGSGGFIGNVTGNTIGSAILTVIGAVMLARPVIKAAKD
ncbi:MAG TPA: protein kinase, partial [Ktedonobacteraceae bacterium]|nr:protein kinase [Ktedonobacteraceae bacterium]